MLFFKKKTIKYNNDLAKRLDTDSDSIFITPLAVINNTLMMIPNLSWKILIGSIIICVALANTSRQYEVILIMCLHIFVFSFFLQVLKPNALVQRHFSVAPYKIARYRSILNAVWLNAIPLLMFANVAETDSVHIYEDSSSYFIVLLSCIGLLYIVGRLLVINLKNKSGSSSATILTCCIAAFFALLAIFSIASGYFYTVVKLINRFAFTCYLILAYYLVAEVAHRMIYVFTTKSFKKARNKSVNDCSALHHVITSLGASPEHLTKRAFRLTNFVLISLTAIFMYFQWNDLASVLGYLDNIKLWQKQELINGQMVETEYLSLFMILLALFILVVTAILYKNLPVLLERLLLVGNDSFFKNSSYTVRVLVSYIIIAVGCIAAAGTLGVHWENLQWLVAALSVGLGFGLQEIFANFVSGLILLLERQVRVGDIITLSDMSGTVSKIRIRATTIMNFENKEVMIPNRLFITSSLTNWSLSSTVTKLSFEVGVAYNADVEKAKKLLHRIIARCPYISKDHAALVYVSELAASSVNIICEVYITKISERKLTSDYLSSNTLRVFAQNDIEIPFNQLDVNVKTLEKEEFLEKIRCSLFKQNNEDLMLENKIGTK